MEKNPFCKQNFTTGLLKAKQSMKEARADHKSMTQNAHYEPKFMFSDQQNTHEPE